MALLALSIEQRVNLLILLGGLECATLAQARAAWRLMDRLELSEDEKQKVDYRIQNVNGVESFTWNNAKAPAEKEFEASDADLKHIERALQGCSMWRPGQARRWLEPLLAQMPEEPEPAAAALTQRA